MSERLWKDTTDVFRVVVLQEQKPSGGASFTVYGPFGTAGIARGSKTRKVSELARYSQWKTEVYTQKLENGVWVTI